MVPPESDPLSPTVRPIKAALRSTQVALSESDPLALEGGYLPLPSTQVVPSTRHQSLVGLSIALPNSGVSRLPGDGRSHLFWIFLAPSLLLRLRHLAPPPPPNSRRCDRHAPWAQAQSELPSPSPGPAPNCSVWQACAAPAQSESGAASGLELVVSFCRVASVYDSSPSVLVAPHDDLLILLMSWTTTAPNHDLEAHVTTAFTCPWQRIIITTVLALGSAKTVSLMIRTWTSLH